MTTATRQDIKAPASLGLRKTEAIIKKVIQENKAWLKEMAEK